MVGGIYIYTGILVHCSRYIAVIHLSVDKLCYVVLDFFYVDVLSMQAQQGPVGGHCKIKSYQCAMLHVKTAPNA